MTITSLSLANIDEAVMDARSADIPAILAPVSIEEWGRLLLDIPAACPRLRRRFPSMPPDEIQDSWTGAHGEQLLAQSIRFTRWLITEYQDVTGNHIRDARVLDFGCGWGRLLRLLYKYVDVDRLYGCDPWDKSIDLCREHGVLGHLAISEYVPRTLPFAPPFDLIYAFSVFTHLSEKTARVTLETLRRYIPADGALVITVRPASYWAYAGQPKMVAEHERKGFAFVPHDRTPIDGDITYGDASITVAYITEHFPDWRVVRERTGGDDPYQTYLLLVPA